MTKISRCLLLLAVCIASFGNANDFKSQPNVLFIAVDDLNDMVGFLKNHPGVKTPHMDRLAQRGITFTNAHCAAPGCAPSRAALLTGLRPSRTGVYRNGDDPRQNSIANQAVTIPEAFQAAGYLTKGGGKIYHAYSFHKRALTGYFEPEHWDAYYPSKQQQMPADTKPPTWPVSSNKRFYGGYFDWAALDCDDNEMADGKVVQWAEQQLASEHSKPLFLAVGIYRPHVPWWTPEKYFQQHPLDRLILPKTKAHDLADVPLAGKQMARQQWHSWIDENDQWKKAVQGYFASMTFADAMIGRLIKALDEGPLARNTLIVLWSDHGYHLGHKSHWEKFALWEQASHVPLVFVDTRTDRLQSREALIQSNTRCGQPASLLDIFPTLCDVCQLQKPETLDGKSLVPCFVDPGREVNKTVVVTHGRGNHAVRSRRWRYLQYADGSEELYDHKNDPNEFENLAESKDFATVKAELASALDSIGAK